MGVTDRVPLLNRVAGYERATIVGIVLVLLGSVFGWLTVEATEEAAADHADVEAGSAVLSGIDLGWGVFTLGLGLIAAVILGLVLWRYGAPGRKTGLVIMLIGAISGVIALIGMLLTGLLFAPADEVEGISVGIGNGIWLGLLGALVMFSGGILRLAAGTPDVEASEEG